MSQFSMRIYL